MSEGWIHNFTITEISTHKKKFTIYKITSIVFPTYIPETLSTISVWKRYREIKKLYKEVEIKQKQYHLKGTLPKIKPNNFFNRFDSEIIDERKQFILDLLYFIAQHPILYKSHVFNTFFNGGHTPNISPIHNKLTPEHSIQSDALSIDLIKDTDDSESNQIEINEVSQETIVTNGLQSLESFQNIDKTDSEDYIYEAALEFSNAIQAEVNGDFRIGFEKYKMGIDKLLTGAKSDQNTERRRIAKDKAEKYLIKAEEIYQNYLLNNEPPQTVNLIPNTDEVDSSNLPNTVYLERPISHLSKYKVVKIIDSVMQVQDITNKKVFIMKVISNIYSSNQIKPIYLCNNIPYMVSIVSYFQSENSIYILLKQASGGKLWDYIKYLGSKRIPEKSNLKDLFIDEKQIHKTETNSLVKNEQTDPLQLRSDDETDESTNRTSESESLTSSGYDSGFIDLVTDYKNRKPSVEVESLTIEIQTGLDIINNITDDNLLEHIETNYIPSFDLLSKDMEVNDLLNCSQKLLKSVSNTLEQSKHTDSEIALMISATDSKKSNLKVPKIKTSELNKQNIKLDETVQNFNESLLMDDIRNEVILPEGSIRKWASELITSVDELHKHNIVCGDLHMNNLLLGSNGQLQLTLFYHNQETNIELEIDTNSEQKFYVAAERPLTKFSDWWSVGVILFELLFLKSFSSCHPGGIFNYFSIQYPETDISYEAKHLLEGLLQIDPYERFEITKIKCHPFFKVTNWDDIKRRGFDVI